METELRETVESNLVDSAIKHGTYRSCRHLDGVEALHWARHETLPHVLAVHFHDANLIQTPTTLSGCGRTVFLPISRTVVARTSSGYVKNASTKSTPESRHTTHGGGWRSVHRYSSYKAKKNV